jgi:predicted permease
VRWLERTHGPRFELARHFLATMFDSEMFSVRGQWGSIAVGAFALTVPAGMILLEAPSGRPPAASVAAALAMTQADRLSSLTLMMSLTAILALLAWQSLFPGRRDYMALAALPLRPRQVFLARFACVLVLAAVLTGVLMLPPAASAPHAVRIVGGGKAGFASTGAARAAATGLGCLFTFFTLVGLQGLLINILPAKRVARWSGYLQGGLLGFFVLAALYSWFIPEWSPASLPGLLRSGAWAPAIWFLGLHEKMSGRNDPFMLTMAARAVRSAAGAIGFAAWMYALAAIRYRRLLVESGEGLAGQRMRESRLARWLSGNQRQQAVMQFMAAVLGRSRMHRLVIMGYGGAGLALMINSLLVGGLTRMVEGGARHALSFIALYWPLGFAIVFLAGIRHAFVMPAELRANWLFRFTEAEGRRDWMAAVERFVITFVILPTHLAAFPLAASVLALPVALRMTVLQALVSLTAFELLFYSWQQLPFACSYVPGKSSLVAQFGIWIVILCAVVPILARVVAALSQMTPVFLCYGPFFVAVWLWARRRRREGWGEAPLIYQDLHGEVADLGIRELSFESAISGTAEPEAEPAPAVAALPSPAPPLAASLRAYRALARAFPREFQDACADDMLVAAEDAVEFVWRGHGRLGLVRLLADIALRVCVEHCAQMVRDIRYGLRALAGSPGFTLVALVSLGLGICIATCSFTEMNGMVLRDLTGVVRPGELVGIEAPVSYPAYRRYRERTDLFSSASAYLPAVPLGLSLHGHSERQWGHLVTPSHFATFGATPALGRFFDADADPATAVASYRLWREKLGGDPGVIGRKLRINGQLVTIIGVAAKEFYGAAPMMRADLWLPLPADPKIAPELAGNALERADLAVMHVVARLKPGVSRAAAEAALDAAARQFEQDTGDLNRNRQGRRVTLLESGKVLPLREQDKPFFTSFFTLIAGLIMMIACANVANMMLARAASRRREIAVRLALGAGRGRIVRQLLTESLLVAVAAGMAGALLSVWLMRILGSMRMPVPIPVSFDFFQPDVRVLLFSFAITLVTGIAFGLTPALQASRADLTPALKEGGNVAVRRFRRLSLRNLLMVSQLAGSLMLLVILGLLSIGIQDTMGIQAGFDPADLYLISLDPVRDGFTPEAGGAILPKLLDRVQSVPGIRAAALASTVPVSMAGDLAVFSTAGEAARGPRAIHKAVRHVVGKDYFDTTGVRILAGRAFRREDEAARPNAIIITEELVREYFPGQDALGRTLEIGNDDPVPTKLLPGTYDYRLAARARGRRTYQVVGVAHDVAEGLLAGKPRPAIYFPMKPADFAQPGQLGVTLLVRAAPGVDAVGLVRREIAALDSNLTTIYSGSMADHIDEFMSPLRSAAWTYGAVGIFGLVLAAVGLAGMTAYSVASRNHEIGIRVALGASRGQVVGLVMQEGARLIAAGTAVGMALGWAASRGLAAMSATVGQVTSTSASDPKVIFGAPLLLASMALAACYIPARRSLRVDPAVTLREE